LDGWVQATPLRLTKAHRLPSRVINFLAGFRCQDNEADDVTGGDHESDDVAGGDEADACVGCGGGKVTAPRVYG